MPNARGLVRRPLVELLDRALQKGVVVQADVLVSLGGVPLLGLSLRGLLAGAETLLQYGVMRDLIAQAGGVQESAEGSDADGGTTTTRTGRGEVEEGELTFPDKGSPEQSGTGPERDTHE